MSLCACRYTPRARYRSAHVVCAQRGAGGARHVARAVGLCLSVCGVSCACAIAPGAWRWKSRVCLLLAGLSIQAGLLLSLSKAGRHESLAGHQTVEAENIFQLETKNSTRKDRKTEIHSTSNARLLETRT